MEKEKHSCRGTGIILQIPKKKKKLTARHSGPTGKKKSAKEAKLGNTIWAKAHAFSRKEPRKSRDGKKKKAHNLLK